MLATTFFLQSLRSTLSRVAPAAVCMSMSLLNIMCLLIMTTTLENRCVLLDVVIQLAAALSSFSSAVPMAELVMAIMAAWK